MLRNVLFDDLEAWGLMAIQRILYVQYTDPAAYPPIEHSSRLLADRGWQVVLLGSGTARNLNLRLPAHPRI